MQNIKLPVIAPLIFLLLASSGVCIAKSFPVGDENPTKPKSASPFEIAKTVNKSRRTWKRSYIQVDVDLGKVWQELELEPGDFSECAGDCEARIYRHNLDGRPGKETVLKLTKSFNFCRYLIFTRIRSGVHRNLKWKLLGHIDHDFNRYQMAEHHVVRAFGKNWFVLRGQEGSGSGYWLYGETWFEVTSRLMRPVLHYCIDGGTDPGIGGLKWHFKNRIIPLITQSDKSPALRLTFAILYTTKDFDAPKRGKRFRVTRHAFFVWNKQTHEFTFDTRRSSISEREMNAVANIGDGDSEESGSVRIGETSFFSGLQGFVGSGFEMFVRLNFGELRRIARGSDKQMREWLREFLQQCDEIPEKTTLEKLLQNQLPRTSERR